jgi:ubiquinone/menaquinone biosynthesis C-methylase UbiE
MESKPSFANEVQPTQGMAALPPYASMLAAFQRAHAHELRTIVAELPIAPGDRVLDMACGNGTYTAWLAERTGANGLVIGVDIAAGYVAQAASERCRNRDEAPALFQIASIAGLPFADNSFDLIWCAYSLYSLPDLIGSLHELRRVLRPGGTLAVLENDTLHQSIIPWPARLELAIRRAQLAALEAQNNTTGKYYIGRQFCRVFNDVGLRDCGVRPYTSTRHAPLSSDERTYLTWYFQDIAQRSYAHIDRATRRSFDLLFNPRSDMFLLDRPDFYVVYIDILACARK